MTPFHDMIDRAGSGSGSGDDDDLPDDDEDRDYPGKRSYQQVYLTDIAVFNIACIYLFIY